MNGAGGFGIGVPELFILAIVCVMFVVAAAIVAWPAGLVCKRVGFSPLLGILAILPILNLVLLWYVALSDWPNLPRTPRAPAVQ